MLRVAASSVGRSLGTLHQCAGMAAASSSEQKQQPGKAPHLKTTLRGKTFSVAQVP